MKGRPILHHVGRLVTLLGAAAFVCGGTYAWQDDTQIRLSELAAVGSLLDVTLVENFTELTDWQAGSGNACVPMQVSVRNDGQQSVWVRLRFVELFDGGTGDVDHTNASAWPVHIWTGESSELHDHITWQTTGDTLLLSEWTALPAEMQSSRNEAGGVWLLDDTTAEGWAYYSCALPAGSSTSVVLDSVTLEQPFQAESGGVFFYAIDIQLDVVAAVDAPHWEDPSQPSFRDSSQHRRNELAGIIQPLPTENTEPSSTPSGDVPVEEVPPAEQPVQQPEQPDFADSTQSSPNQNGNLSAEGSPHTGPQPEHSPAPDPSGSSDLQDPSTTESEDVLPPEIIPEESLESPAPDHTDAPAPDPPGTAEISSIPPEDDR